jgi:ribonuclease D
LTASQDAIVDTLMALVRLSAAENDLNPAVLANRKQLEQLALGNQDSPLLKGWRKSLVGDRLSAMLAGEVTLRVTDGKLQPVSC